MIKFAASILIILVVALIRYDMLPPSSVRSDGLNITGGLIACWFGILGCYLGWKLLLIMVRQFAAAVRGK